MEARKGKVCARPRRDWLPQESMRECAYIAGSAQGQFA
jgi:hypothetical protein